MLEWLLIAGVGAAVVEGLFGAKKHSPAEPMMRAPTLGPTKRLSSADLKEQLIAWRRRVDADVDRSQWIASGSVACLLAKHPPPLLGFDSQRFAQSLRTNVMGRSDAFGLTEEFDAHNAAFLERQKVELKSFFDTVESSPLTDEQIHACVCLDDSVMLVAAAGSGKTSTMVAKGGYVMKQGLARPDQILLLAFNRNAADELGQRVRTRLAAFEDIDKVTTKTFDAFGLSVIAQATGKKPSLAPWVATEGLDVAFIEELATSLSARDPAFKLQWDLFRTVYGRDVGGLGQSAPPEDFDGPRRGFRTADGTVVKSKEERQISDWLFFHGVDYRYEQPYEHDTANAHYGQYRPDFYYPALGLYHEHFALDENGRAPAHFTGDYVAGVKWKRALHEAQGTALLETTSAQMRSGSLFQGLALALSDRGVSLAFDPDRKGEGPPPLSSRQLASTLRVFQQHVKSNRATHADLDQAAIEQGKSGDAYRLKLFLELYKRIEAEWELRLKDGGYVDFQDMLRLASDHIEAGRYISPYTVVLADEFQDSSRARARLLQALTRQSDAVRLTVVGDDWQGINRFAGADSRVMSEFGAIFRYATTLQLTTTFRCPQALCDLSSAFIQANPRQLEKTVHSTNAYSNRPLQAWDFKDISKAEDLIEEELEHLAELLANGKVEEGKDGRTRILLLGRYRHDAPMRLAAWRRRFEGRLNLEFRTVHAAKGLEAEYVYLLNLVEDRYGFPSQIEDDPVLRMAMPEPETYPMAEERRLFYVALTRARRQVRILTSLERPSRFVAELVSKNHLKIEAVDGEAIEPCPKCRMGVLKLRTRGHSPFFGCSRYPQCDFKRQ